MGRVERARETKVPAKTTLSVEVYHRLVLLAKRDERSIGSMIRIAVHQYLESRSEDT